MPDPGPTVWPDLTAGGRSAVRPDKAKSVSRAMLALGAGLLLFVPLGGALFLTAGVLGLAIASEAPATGPATRAQPSSPADQ